MYALKKDLYIKIVLWVLVLLCMAMIFHFSSESSVESKKTSSHLTELTKKIINILPFNEVNKENLIKGAEHFVRKTAHFTEYFLLGVLTLSACLKTFKKRNFWIALLICFIYSVSDEVHQIFVPGRAFMIGDILLDTVGSLSGLIVFVYLRYIVMSKILRHKNWLIKEDTK